MLDDISVILVGSVICNLNALISVNDNNFFQLAGKVIRVRPARSYCRPMMHFIFMYKSKLGIIVRIPVSSGKNLSKMI